MSILDDLEEMTGALGGAGTALDGLSQSFGRFDNALTSTSSALQRTAPAVINTGSAAKGTGAALDVLKGKASSLAEGLVPTSGALGTVSKALQALGPEGEAAAIALGVLVTVLTAVTDTLWGWVTAAVAAAQTRDALVSTFDAVTGAGEKTLAQIDAIAGSLPYTTSQVRQWGQAMSMVGKTGADLDLAVRAIAASAAVSRTGGEAAERLIKRWQEMAETGQKVKLDRRQLEGLANSGVDLAYFAQLLGTTKDKLGSVAQDAKKLGDAFELALVNKGSAALENVGLTWDSIKAKMSEGFGSIFAGMSEAVKPLMKEIQSLFAEFNKGSTTLGPVKSLMTSLLTAVFSAATMAVHWVHLAFLTAEIAALKLYIAAAPLVRLFRTIFSNAQVLLGLKIILGLIAAPFAVLLGVVVAVGAGIAILAGIVGAAASLIAAGVGFLVGAITTGIPKAWAYLQGLEDAAVNAAAGFIAGLVGGIKAGIGAVADAVKSVASGAVSAFTGALGIKSPSRVMRAHGRQLPAGAAEGIDDGADEAQRSMEEMLEPPKAKPRAAGAGKDGDRIYNINFYGTAKDFPSFREQMMRFLQQEEGAGPEPA